MNKSLTVYKASAGSGKTFTLAVEYIKLLINDPHCYRKILAVTFTNKATEEMKMRILSQLYGIWKKLPDSASYADKVCESLGVSREYASKQAGVALYNLLHNYNYFRIETIDSFFQSILRNLARELDLTTNLRLGLNDKQVEELAVDKLIESLDSKNEVLFWIIDYIKEKISNDKSWNVINEIKRFGLTIFKDKYKDSSKELDSFLSKKDNYDKYVSLLRKISKEAQEKMCEYGERFLEAVEAEGLEMEDFKFGKSGVYGFFLKLKDGVFDETIVGKRIEGCLDDTANWYTKKTSAKVAPLVDNKLYDLLKAAVEDRPKQWKNYKSAELTLKHINQLRLLSIIEKKVIELNKEANRFMLSDTQHLLQSLIDGTDSPFIFEKIGSHLSHIMIDEFQDTSTVQWQNFKVLLLDCMSQEGSHNLIVGDVKQSIYRWRSGDWRLLNNISDEFAANNKLIEHVSLDKNYRSQRNIINFNNAFFEAVKACDGIEEINSAYSDVEQKVPEDKGDYGYVKVELLPNDDYIQNTLCNIKAFIEQLIDNGIKQSEIAILVRVNSQIPLIADYLQKELYDRSINIVSDEAFRLGSSTAVNILVNALHLLVHPEDNLVKATLANIYQTRILNSGLTDAQLLTDGDKLDRWLPESYITSRLELLKMPLFELCQHLLALFEIDRLKSEGGYIATFNDKLMELITDRSADITLLLNEWEENISKVSIQGTEVDGVRLLSIHKSKGLEFENVIIPFCDWELEKVTGNVILCHTDAKPYGDLPLIPIDYNTKMKNTVYDDIYQDEHSQNMVDNLNLLYVGFTRAVSNLYVIGRRNAKSTRSELIEACIDDVCKSLKTSVLCDNGKDGSMIFEYGNIYRKETTGKKESINVFLQPSANQGINVIPSCTKAEFRQSNDSIRFTQEDEQDDIQGTYIKMGLVMHEILSKIKTIDDVDKVLNALEQDGVLYDETITNSKIKSMLKKRLEDTRVADWFSGKWDVINETAILSKNNPAGGVRLHRPDRVIVNGSDAVVIDFKFGKQKEEHKQQVKEYMCLLSDMGYSNVSGYIWYVYTNKIEEV